MQPKLSSTIWILHRKIFWKKILILENDLVIKSLISEVLSQLKVKPSGHPLPISTKFGNFIHFLASVSVQHCSVEEPGRAKTWEMSNGFSIQRSKVKFVLLTLIYTTCNQLRAKGLTKCVRYTEVSFFRVSFFHFFCCHWAEEHRYTEHFVTWRFVILRFHCTHAHPTPILPTPFRIPVPSVYAEYRYWCVC